MIFSLTTIEIIVNERRFVLKSELCSSKCFSPTEDFIGVYIDN